MRRVFRRCHRRVVIVEDDDKPHRKKTGLGSRLLTLSCLNTDSRKAPKPTAHSLDTNTNTDCSDINELDINDLDIHTQRRSAESCCGLLDVAGDRLRRVDASDVASVAKKSDDDQESVTRRSQLKLPLVPVVILTDCSEQPMSLEDEDTVLSTPSIQIHEWPIMSTLATSPESQTNTLCSLSSSHGPLHRSLSEPTSPISEDEDEQSRLLTPEVVVSDFSECVVILDEDNEDNQVERVKKKNRMSRLHPDIDPSLNNLCLAYVTLEDVAKYKNRRRLSHRSGSSRRSSRVFGPGLSVSRTSSISGSMNLLVEDAWSYTNSSCGSSEHNCSGHEALFNARRREGKALEAEDKDAFTPDDQLFIQHSGWRKLKNMVQWTPFVQTYRHKKYQWVQLAGHSGNFKAGKQQGTVLKKLCVLEEACYQCFENDAVAPFVPDFQGTVVSDDDEKFLQLHDCLSSFCQPSVMDCKIGVRTYLEDELAKAKENPKLRKDMYDKMVAVDPDAPTDEEHRLKGVTKPRYMVWRETISSTATLGFRIEGVKKSDGTSSKDFKTTKSREQVADAFVNFIDASQITAQRYLERLREISKALRHSHFFSTHELIGSSLLFVHDAERASIWLIDFGKTVRLPEGVSIDHKSPWAVGNHEDGYLIGVDNLIDIFASIASDICSNHPDQDQASLRRVQHV